MSGANFFLLFLSVLGAMSYLTAVLGQFPPKTTFKVFVFGFALELILLLISLLLYSVKILCKLERITYICIRSMPNFDERPIC